MRYLRCKCGKSEMWTTDGVYECQGCSECNTIFAGEPKYHKELKLHKPVKRFSEKTGEFSHYICETCCARCNEDGTKWRK